MAAATGTQLWDKSKNKIYPIGEARGISSTANNLSGNYTVHDNLVDIYEQLMQLTGDKEAVDNIDFEIHYKRSRSKLQQDIIKDEGWNVDFINPTSDFPYTWKRTKITYKGGTPKVVYEIVASNNAELTQTIYISLPDGTSPTIIYPTKAGIEDLTAFDVNLPTVGDISWSEVPMDISEGSPNAYMSTRKKVDGLWKKFSTPAKYGKWAFDSVLELRYTVTLTNRKPELRNGEIIPDPSDEQEGEVWKTENDESFTGYLWMISASSVNGKLQKHNGVVWNGPNLLAKM